MGKRVVVALGGNAILQPGQKGTAEEQRANVAVTARQIAQMLQDGYEVVLTHGNGPQVGAIMLQNEAGADQVPSLPMDICGAESQGMIGYLFQQALSNEMTLLGIPPRPVATVVTQVVVGEDDPAFSRPSKPVGPFRSEAEAKARMAETGEVWIEDAGRGWRRVVASPEPLAVVEKDAIQALVEAGTVVICSGGGGIPVFRKQDGTLMGAEAVIDKDLAAECLAGEVGADLFMILTDVPGVALHYRTPQEKWLEQVTVREALCYLEEGHFRAGSMEPKVKACVRFVEAGGEVSIIAALDRVAQALAGNAGTRFTR